MEKNTLYDLLAEKMSFEIDYLNEILYSQFPYIKFSKSIKSFIKNDALLSQLYKNLNCLSRNQFDEEELLIYLKDTYNDKFIDANNSCKLLLFSIPVFNHLLNSNNVGTRNMARSLFFKLHCVSNFYEYLFNDNADYANVFDFKSICGIEHLKDVSNSDLSLKSVLNFLNFANFELAKDPVNNDNDRLYRSKLKELYDDLYKYFNFVAPEETASKFDGLSKKQDGWKIEYSKDELKICNSNFNLVKFFYAGSLKEYTNKYYQLNKMEEKMKSVTDATQRKEMLLASFCYSEFCDNEFFNSFDDVSLSLEDLINFINKYETSGNRFTKRQADSLLKSFEKKYFVCNGLEKIYGLERRFIKNVYDNFYRTNFGFSKFDFIDYINEVYTEGFSTFGFDGEHALDFTTLMRILNDKFVGYEQLQGTNLFNDYYTEEICNKSLEQLQDEDKSLSKYRSEMFEKIRFLIPEYLSSGLMPNYFLSRNTAEGEFDIAREAFEVFKEDWEFTDNNILQLRKLNTVERLKEDLVEDLNAIDFDKRRDLLKLYKGYIIDNELSGIFSEGDLSKFYNKCVSERSYREGVKIVEILNKAMANGENLYLAVKDFHFLTEDIKIVLKKYDVSLDVYEKYKNDKEQVLAFESANLDSTEDVKTGVSSSGKQVVSVDNVNEIINSIRTGVVMPNGNIRKYTDFDLLMQLGDNISVKDMWRIFYVEQEDKEAKDTFKDFVKSSILFSNSVRVEHQYVCLTDGIIRNSDYSFIKDDEPYKVSDEERATVLDFLHKNNFPLALYYSAVRAYVNGEFDPNVVLTSHVIREEGSVDDKAVVKVKTYSSNGN